MIQRFTYLLFCSVVLFACKHKEKNVAEKPNEPVVSNNGTQIRFADLESVSFFKTENIKVSNVEAELDAPGKIAATVLSSEEGAAQNIILFDNPELAGNYTQLIQHQINIVQIQNIIIKQKQIELDRIKDLQEHGAATGHDLLNAQTELAMAQTNLASEKAALIEHETKLKSGGFNPEMLRKAHAGTAYIICDIPENQLSKIKKGQSCNIMFTAFPNEKFYGKIDAVADVVDNLTRMVKVRVSIVNENSKLKSGMFANISFGLSEGQFITIPNTSLLTVQGKNYVFVKKNTTEFERKEIQIGQQIGDRIIVYGGVQAGDSIAVQGVMQLKGLSFGY